VATIKDDLDNMRLKQEQTNQGNENTFINIAIDDEEYSIHFSPGFLPILIALILICKRNQARDKIREDQFEAFCQATATSVLKCDEKEIIGRYILGKMSKEPVVSMDVAAATEWYLANIAEELRDYGRENRRSDIPIGRGHSGCGPEAH